MIKTIPKANLFCWMKVSKVTPPPTPFTNTKIELKQLPEDMQEFIEAQDAELTTHTITIDHTHLTADQILRKLLPPNIDIPSSFETIGHIAHLNLREEQFPYKKAIAEVILDVCTLKLPCCNVISCRKTLESKQL